MNYIKISNEIKVKRRWILGEIKWRCGQGNTQDLTFGSFFSLFKDEMNGTSCLKYIKGLNSRCTASQPQQQHRLESREKEKEKIAIRFALCMPGPDSLCTCIVIELLRFIRAFL
jgi:hypothetical protein